MKRVYVAGKYSADNVISVLENIRIGNQAATEVFLAGFAPFSPWLDHQFQFYLQGDEKLEVKDYYEYSLAWLEVSDAMLVLPGYEESKGTLAEIVRANELNIPIFYSLKDLKEHFNPTIIVDRVLIEFGEKNKNGRTYIKKDFMKHLGELNHKAEEGVLLGELNDIESIYKNPFSEESINSVVSLKNVSHKITKLKIEDNKLKANIKVLDTPQGKILNGLIDSFVFRPRLIGYVDPNGVVKIEKLISFDAIPKENDAFK